MRFMIIPLLCRQLAWSSMLFLQSNCSKSNSIHFQFTSTVHSPSKTFSNSPWYYRTGLDRPQRLTDAVPNHGSKQSAVRLQWQNCTRSMEKDPKMPTEADLFSKRCQNNLQNTLWQVQKQTKQNKAKQNQRNSKLLLRVRCLVHIANTASALWFIRSMAEFQSFRLIN